ncbi:MAG: hypothetical protein AAGA85_02790 [Bacteroidota bacterium]
MFEDTICTCANFRFLGVKPFNESIDFELTTSLEPGTTRQERREAIANVIKSGLAPFAINFAEADLGDEATNTAVPQKEKDPWNFWVFSISSEMDFEQESLRREIGLSNEFDVRRVTEEWRIRGQVEHEYQQTQVDTDDGDFISTLNNYWAWGQVANSLGPHYSIGAGGMLWKNSVRNIQLGRRVFGAFEYSVFPYEEVYKREFTFAYRLGVNSFKYDEVTLFDKLAETLPYQSVQARFNLVKPWGNVNLSAEGFAYMHDFSKNRLEFFSRVSTRLVQGLFLNTRVNFNLIHDQIFLARGDASLEEVLLNRQQLATDFEYGFRIGVSYVFGSIYNNIVNTRL